MTIDSLVRMVTRYFNRNVHKARFCVALVGVCLAFYHITWLYRVIVLTSSQYIQTDDFDFTVHQGREYTYVFVSVHPYRTSKRFLWHQALRFLPVYKPMMIVLLGAHHWHDAMLLTMPYRLRVIRVFAPKVASAATTTPCHEAYLHTRELSCIQHDLRCVCQLAKHTDALS